VTTLDALARPRGTFLMVALDQRESLRTMLRDRGRDDSDGAVDSFKRAVARELAPHASGLLIDRDHVEGIAPLVPHGLILAVDLLVQERGGIVEDTSLDGEPPDVPGVVALKLLVIWRDDERRAERVELARRFVGLAEERGLLSVLEPVTRDDATIVDAARELGAVGPSLYKCQVPTGGGAAPAEITRRCREIDAVLPCPWVVLSQGVDPDRFPAAVEASCKGGASGMLAGRAVWTPALDDEERLRSDSVPRLEELAAIVDEHGTPWHAR